MKTSLSLRTFSVTLVAFTSSAFSEITFTVDRSNYLSGEGTHYRISGAPPNTPIFWSSTRNGISTGETNAYYDHVTDENGNWEATGGAFDAETMGGSWTKEARIGVDGPVLTRAFNVSDAIARAPSARPALTLVNWGSPDIVKGADLVQQLGAKNIKIAMSYQSHLDYPNTYVGQPKSLTELSQTAPFKNVLDRPFERTMIVAYPFSNPDFLTHPNPEAVEQEMYDFTKHLIESYAGTGKEFILQNWEGDWQLCEECKTDPTFVIPQERLTAMKAYLDARHRGMERARNELAAVQGVKVKDAIEFVLLSRTRSGQTSMLRDVIPYVQSDYISYSSYETVQGPALGELGRRILDDLAFIRNYPGVDGRELLIGEYGFDSTLPDTESRMQIASEAFQQAGVPLAAYWTVEGVPHTYALFQNGTQTALGTTLQRLISREITRLKPVAPAETARSARRLRPLAASTLLKDANLPWTARLSNKAPSLSPTAAQ